MPYPLISVILPVFNAESYISESVSSILSQTFNDFELIIINDGSTDNSESIILSFNDERIKYYRNDKNRGLIYTLNRGLKLSKGKYIARMDADDICNPNRFEEQISFLQNHIDIGVVGSEAIIFQGEYKDCPKNKCGYFHKPKTDKEIKAKLFVDNPIIHPTVLIRKEILEKTNGYNSNFYQVEDLALWIELSKNTKFYNIPNPLINYRITPSSETRLSQENPEKRHESLKRVTYYLFDTYNIRIPEEELDNYVYSLFKPNFNKVSIEILKNAYIKVIAQTSNKYIIRELSIRWIGVFYFRKNLILKRFFYFFFSKFTYIGLWGLLFYKR